MLVTPGAQGDRRPATRRRHRPGPGTARRTIARRRRSAWSTSLDHRQAITWVTLRQPRGPRSETLGHRRREVLPLGVVRAGRLLEVGEAGPVLDVEQVLAVPREDVRAARELVVLVRLVDRDADGRVSPARGPRARPSPRGRSPRSPGDEPSRRGRRRARASAAGPARRPAARTTRGWRRRPISTLWTTSRARRRRARRARASVQRRRSRSSRIGLAGVDGEAPEGGASRRGHRIRLSAKATFRTE